MNRYQLRTAAINSKYVRSYNNLRKKRSILRNKILSHIQLDEFNLRKQLSKQNLQRKKLINKSQLIIKEQQQIKESQFQNLIKKQKNEQQKQKMINQSEQNQQLQKNQSMKIKACKKVHIPSRIKRITKKPKKINVHNEDYGQSQQQQVENIPNSLSEPNSYTIQGENNNNSKYEQRKKRMRRSNGFIQKISIQIIQIMKENPNGLMLIQIAQKIKQRYYAQFEQISIHIIQRRIYQSMAVMKMVGLVQCNDELNNQKKLRDYLSIYNLNRQKLLVYSNKQYQNIQQSIKQQQQRRQQNIILSILQNKYQIVKKFRQAINRLRYDLSSKFIDKIVIISDQTKIQLNQGTKTIQIRSNLRKSADVLNILKMIIREQKLHQRYSKLKIKYGNQDYSENTQFPGQYAMMSLFQNDPSLKTQIKEEQEEKILANFEANLKRYSQNNQNLDQAEHAQHAEHVETHKLDQMQEQ